MIETLKNWILAWAEKGKVSLAQRRLAQQHGLVMDAYQWSVATKQAKCKHLKGGSLVLCGPRENVAAALLAGNATQYSVVKHQHVNGDIWVSCIRCGKKWRPPVRSEYQTDREYYRAVEEYETAKEFPTNNVMSSSVQCRFVLAGSMDAGHEYVRKQMANS